MKKINKSLSMLILCLLFVQILFVPILAYEKQQDNKGDSDCINGAHRMVRVGGAIIYGTDGTVRYNNDWAAYKCPKCEAYFACEGDPVFYHTIGLYFVNPTLWEAAFTNYKFKTDSEPSYKENTPLSGFEFFSSKKFNLNEINSEENYYESESEIESEIK